MFQNKTCAQSVSLLQNSEIYVPKHDMRPKNSERFENEIKNREKLKIIHLKRFNV